MPLEQEDKEAQGSSEGGQDDSQARKDKDEEVCHSEEDGDVEPPPNNKLQATGASSLLSPCKAVAGTSSHG